MFSPSPNSFLIKILSSGVARCSALRVGRRGPSSMLTVSDIRTGTLPKKRRKCASAVMLTNMYRVVASKHAVSSVKRQSRPQQETKLIENDSPGYRNHDM